MLSGIFNYNEQKITKNIFIYFFVIFFINVAFKLIYLDYSSFWYDEIISVQSASLNFGHIKHVSEWDKNPPFYYYCLSIWIKLFNNLEFFVRLLSVIFSSLAGALLFIICNKIFNKTTAILSSIFYLSSNLLFFYSHEARAYSLVLLLVLISTYLFFNFKESQNIKNIILLGLVNFLLIYTHYVSGLVIIFQCIIILFYFNKNQKIKYSFSLLIVIVLVLLRFTQKQLQLIIDFNSPQNSFWLKTSDFNYFLEMVQSFMLNSTLFLAVFIFTLLLLPFLLLKYKLINNFYIIYFFICGIGSIIILFILGLLTPIFLDRYIIFSIPFILSLVAYGLAFFKNKILSYGIAILIFIICLVKIDFKTEKNMDYKNAVTFIKSIKKSNDLTIVKTKDLKPLFCYYYDKDYFYKQKTDLNPNENIIFCTSWADVNKNLKDYNRIIVVDSFQNLNPKDGDFTTNLLKFKNTKSKIKFFKGVTITFYQ